MPSKRFPALKSTWMVLRFTRRWLGLPRYVASDLSLSIGRDYSGLSFDFLAANRTLIAQLATGRIKLGEILENHTA